MCSLEILKFPLVNWSGVTLFSRVLIIQAKIKIKEVIDSDNWVGLFPKAAQIAILIEPIMKTIKNQSPMLQRIFSLNKILTPPEIGALMGRKVLDCWSNLLA